MYSVSSNIVHKCIGESVIDDKGLFTSSESSTKITFTHAKHFTNDEDLRKKMIQFFLELLQVTSDMKTQLTSQMHDDDLRTFLVTKETWSPQTFDSIDWYAIDLALRRLSKNHQMKVVKFCHNYWYTGSLHQTFYGGDRP
jgi:predicted SnoaL-like aldol condensation-catalyzing enzyme